MDKHPLESGFDDPQIKIRIFQRSTKLEYGAVGVGPSTQTTSPKPWPLCFTILGLALILVVLYLLTGCSSTKITTPYLTMRTQSNLKNFTASKDSVHFDEMNHSTPTLAGGKAFSNGTATFGTAATGLAAGLLSHGL